MNSTGKEGPLSRLFWRQKRIGEVLFGLSYVFFIVYFFQFFRKKIFDGDALHVALLLQWVGYFLGGRDWGGPAWGKWLQRWSGPRPWMIVYALWSGVWAIIALLRYYAFRPNTLDLGIFVQTLWNLSRGRGYLTHFTVGGWPSYLSDHQNFTLPLFAPLFWTPIGPELLLIAQSFLLFVPGLVLAFWTRRKSWSPLWSWAALLSWLFFPVLARNTIWDFHETALTVSFLSLWAWALVERRGGWMVLGALLAALTKEHLCLALLPGVLLYVARYRAWRMLGLAASLLILFWMDNRIFASGVQLGRYPLLGANASEILHTVFLEPSRVAAILYEPSRIRFLGDLLAPLVLAPLWGGIWALAWMPVFFAHALSSHWTQFSPHFHYALEIWSVMWPIGILAWYKFFVRSRWGLPILFTAILWHLPTSFVIKGQEFLVPARACAKVRSDLRAQIREKRARCSEELEVFTEGAVIPQVADLIDVRGFGDTRGLVPGKCVLLIGTHLRTIYSATLDQGTPQGQWAGCLDSVIESYFFPKATGVVPGT